MTLIVTLADIRSTSGQRGSMSYAECCGMTPAVHCALP